MVVREALKRVPPLPMVLLAIVSVQFGSSFAKDLFSASTPVTVVWLRLLAAAVVLAVVARPRVRGRTASDWWLVTAYGTCLWVMNLTFYLAIERIPVGLAVTLEFLGPLGVAVAHSRRVRDYLWVALAAGGVLLLGFKPGALDPIGVVLALAAASMWAGYILLSKPTGARFDGVTAVTIANWQGVIALTPVVLIAGILPTQPHVWAIGLAVGVLSSVIPYGLEMIALRRMEPGLFGILMSLEPAAAALTALVVLGEQLSLAEVAAMVCVMAASVGATRSSRAS